jgi:hypothetical protein
MVSSAVLKQQLAEAAGRERELVMEITARAVARSRHLQAAVEAGPNLPTLQSQGSVEGGGVQSGGCRAAGAAEEAGGITPCTSPRLSV